MKVHITLVDSLDVLTNENYKDETLENISSIHETQNSLIFITDLKATKVASKQDIDKIVISGLR